VQSRDWRRVRRVLAVRTDDPADVLHLGPALRTLKGALPGVEVTLLTSPAGSVAAPLLPWVDDVVPHRAIWQDTIGDEPVDVEAQVDLIDQLQRRAFDAALMFTRAGASPWPAAYITYLAGIGLRVGQSAEQGGGLLTHVVEPLPDGAHQVDRNLHLLEASGLAVAGRRLELSVPEPAEAAAEAALLRSRIPPGEPFIVLAPGAEARSRRYPAERYAEVCRLLTDRTAWPVVIVGARLDIALGAEIAAAANRSGVTTIAGQTTLPELAAVVARSACVITNHSVVMHLADAFRRPMVVLFAGTDRESAWRPRGAPATLLRRPTQCSPCHSFTCPYDNECLNLPASLVANEAMGRIGSVAGWEPTSSAATLALAGAAAAGHPTRPSTTPRPGVAGVSGRQPSASPTDADPVAGPSSRPPSAWKPDAGPVAGSTSPRALPSAGGGPADRFGDGAGPAWQERT
jgi:ADP-heptose:LPS heptosyltransferase